MKLSNEVKAIARTIISINGWHTDSVKGLLSNLDDLIDDDFTVDYDGMEFRVINDNDILDILTNELESGEYMLGCFNASFLSSILDVDSDAIESIQKSGAFEGLGKMIKGMDKVQEVAEDYASADGYGHHFAGYDHEGHETDMVDGSFYHIFRIN